MRDNPKPNEWNLLKQRFDRVVHCESEQEDRIEQRLDEEIRLRFGEWISRATTADFRDWPTHRGPTLL